MRIGGRSSGRRRSGAGAASPCRPWSKCRSAAAASVARTGAIATGSIPSARRAGRARGYTGPAWFGIFRRAWWTSADLELARIEGRKVAERVEPHQSPSARRPRRATGRPAPPGGRGRFRRTAIQACRPVARRSPRWRPGRQGANPLAPSASKSSRQAASIPSRGSRPSGRATRGAIACRRGLASSCAGWPCGNMRRQKRRLHGRVGPRRLARWGFGCI